MIPVRIAGERNREYVLVKNEGEGGGWILGIRDEGTMDKPIEIDQDSSEHEHDDEAEEEDEEESDMEMEEVNMYVVVDVLYGLILTLMAILQDQGLRYLILIFGSTNEAWHWLLSASARRDLQDHDR